MGCGSGHDLLWRRLREWEEAGEWRRLHWVLFVWGRPTRSIGSELRWTRRARQKGARRPARNRRLGATELYKRHLVSDRKGVPLAVVLTDANVHHSNVFEKLVDAIQPIKYPSRGRPIKRPEKLHADKGTHAKKCRQPLRKRAIKSRLARKGKDSSERLGRYRWVAERTLLA